VVLSSLALCLFVPAKVQVVPAKVRAGAARDRKRGAEDLLRPGTPQRP
jgi:hypothetical protein